MASTPAAGKAASADQTVGIGGASTSTSSSFLGVPVVHHGHAGRTLVNDEADEDDDATVGARTPRLTAQQAGLPLPDADEEAEEGEAQPSHRPLYSVSTGNLSQATIIPLPPPTSEEPSQQHTYTSLGSHLSLEHAAPTHSGSDSPGPANNATAEGHQESSFLHRCYSHVKHKMRWPFGSWVAAPHENRLSSAALFTLTLALAGAQLTWTLELAYGNLFLLSLGLSKAHSALVWLAGPLSGLIAQPLIGALSDRIGPDSKWRPYRRRLFLVSSAAVLTLSTALLAFVQPCARFAVDAILRIGEADWDPERIAAVDRTTKFLAVLAFWILDLALNGLQAAARALILDVAPREQQSQANAWHGRMTHAGNVLGYAAGWADLGSTLPFLRWLGGGQFRKLAIFSLVGMLLCVGVTCVCTKEPVPSSQAGGNGSEDNGDSSLIWTSPPLSSARPSSQVPDIERPAQAASPRRDPASTRHRSKISARDGTQAAHTKQRKQRRRKRTKSEPAQKNALMSIISHIIHATRTLPRPLARVCIVQLFAFSAWFPFLFFSTTYIVELERAAAPPRVPGKDDREGDRDTERGSFAMLLYALVALCAGSALPYLAVAARRQRAERKEARKAQATSEEPTAAGADQPPPTAETDGGTITYDRADVRNGPTTTQSSRGADTSVGYTSFTDHALVDDEDNADDELDYLLRAPHSGPSPPSETWLSRFRAQLPEGLTLRTLWTLGSVLIFVLLTLGTYILPVLAPGDTAKGAQAQVHGAMFLVACMGIPWAVASWVPFALLGEFLKEGEERGRYSTQNPDELDEEGGGGGSSARRGVRDALLDCAPLPSTSSPSSSTTRQQSHRRVTSTPPRRARVSRRSPSDLLPNQVRDDGPSSDEDDEGSSAGEYEGRQLHRGGRRVGGRSGDVKASFADSEEENGADGLRVLPTSDAYNRRLEEEERRRAVNVRRRRMLEEVEAENRAVLESGAEDDILEDDEDEYDGRGDGDEYDEPYEGGHGDGSAGGTSAGTILGIHNLAIVLPQFFVALVATLIFRLSGSSSSDQGSGGSGQDSVAGVVLVLRFGGCMALLAGVATRFVPLTRIEREAKEEKAAVHARLARLRERDRRRRRSSAALAAPFQ